MAIPLKVNMRSLVVRRTATLLTIGGIGLVVMALSVVWGLQQGLVTTFTSQGDPHVLVVLRGGSTVETTSGFLDETATVIKSSEGIDKDIDGEPLAAGEGVVITNLVRRGAKVEGGSKWAAGANVLVRGLDAKSMKLRPGAKIVAGRMFEPGRNELVTSKSMAERFEGCGLGETITLRRVPYTVVGTFECPGPYGSEIWGDEKDIAAAFSRNGAVSSVTLRATDDLARATLKSKLEADPRLNVTVIDQRKFFSDQSSTSQGLTILGTLMTVLLSIGACFAAANTMYASVLSRSREVGTLRALGFSRLAILVSYLVESLVVALAAGVVGLLLGSVVLLFAGTAGTGSNAFTEITFRMTITAQVVVICLATSAFVGTIGGLLPSLRAARMPIVEALRAG